LYVPKIHRKNEILQNACFPVLQKQYISNMRGIIGGAVYRLTDVITDGLSFWGMGTAFIINRLSDCNGGGLSSNRRYYRRSIVAGMGTAFPSTGYQITTAAAVYRTTGVITDGLSLRVWVRRSHQQAIGLTAARSTVQQELLQTVYRCG